MRDALLFAIVFGAIPFVLYRPQIGVLMYVWLSVMNPHRLTWGPAHDFGFAAITAGVTLVGTVFARDRKPLPLNALSIVLLLFVMWTTVTTIFAFYPAEAYERWSRLMKTELMVLLIPLLMNSKEGIRNLIWVIVLSLAYYGTKGGVFVLLTGGQYRIWGPEDSYIEDNNALAVALIMIFPMMRYLQLTTRYRTLRWALLGMMVTTGLAILGSYSRGALLAIVAMLAFLWLKGRHRMSFLLIGLIVIPFALMYMPDRWYQRMDTIANYQQDSSANLRLNAWQTMFNIALDHPLVGAGYEVATQEIFDRYSPDPTAPPQVAHSIYFEAMGAHGFVGFALYLLLLILHWRHIGAVVRATDDRPDLLWANQFGRMMQVSIVGFAVGGAFLNLVNFDVPYYLMGATLVVRRLIDRQLETERASSATRGSDLPGAPAGRINV